MNYPRKPLDGAIPHNGAVDTVAGWKSPGRDTRPRSGTLTRRFEISWLTPNHEIDQRNSIGPAIPMFEQAFNAYARGSLVETPSGATAVEDLRPGMLIDVIGADPAPLVWVGSMTMLPSDGHQGLPASDLFRITEGGFGLSSSMPDLMLGSGARMLPNGVTADTMARLQNIQEYCDGQTVIQVTPRSPVKMYHLGLASHSLIRVNDIVMESYHPGHNPHMRLSEEMFEIFLSLFPHIRRIDDFGPLNHLRHDRTPY